MQIIGIADIHGTIDYSDQAGDALRSADLVLCAGDLTDFGAAQDAERILENIRRFNPDILAVSGNCDQPGVNTVLSASDINLHNRPKIFQNIALYGLGGSNPSPFHTPQELDEDQIAQILGNYHRIEDARWHVFVTHAPPAGTKVDRTFFGQHVGSSAVRAFIEKFRPDLVLCGHIHEARGSDMIHDSVVINPGRFPKHHAIISLNSGMNYTLV